MTEEIIENPTWLWVVGATAVAGFHSEDDAYRRYQEEMGRSEDGFIHIKFGTKEIPVQFSEICIMSSEEFDTL